MIRISEIYLSRERRDARYKELKAQGHDVFRRTVRGALLHPMYVQDYEGPEKRETGFGNSVYRTMWPVLYKVETLERRVNDEQIHEDQCTDS